MIELYSESLIQKNVIYSLTVGDKFYLIENVPARVNEETGEQFFSPATVEQIQTLIFGNRAPDRFIETPVYQFQSA